MLRTFSRMAAIAALPVVFATAACGSGADSAGPGNNLQGNQQPAATPAPANPAGAPAAPADDKTAPPADGSGAAAPTGSPDAKGLQPGAPAAEGQPPRPAANEPEYREVTLPAGTVLPLELGTSVGSDTSQVEDPVQATVRRAVVVNGVEAIPAGSRVSGVVTDATRSGRVKGRARIALRFTSLHAHGERQDVRTSVVSRVAPATKKQDAAKIGVGAGAGAVIGGIVGGGSGAAKGAAIGGAGGTGVVLATRGKEVRLPAGANLAVKLLEPVTVRVR